MKYVYDNTSTCIRLHENTSDFKTEWGVRQIYVISHKLFITLLEYMFKNSNIENLGINIHGKKLNHLCFADDIVLVTDDLGEAKEN